MKADFTNISRGKKGVNKAVRELFIVFIVLGLICLCSCEKPQKATEQGLDVEIYEESEYYKITREKDGFYCYFYNNAEQVKVEGPLNKLPKVIEVHSGLIRFTVQSGTGIGTQWGYYYDTKRNVFSELFPSIYDQTETKTVFVENNKVVIKDIFDQKKYYKVIGIDEEKFSKVAEPIIGVEFVDNGHSVMIVYFSGNDYKEITETFKIEEEKK